MKALVGVKRVIDFKAQIRINPDQNAIDKTNLKMSINPFCEIALEEAIRMKEKGWVKKISAVSIGDKQCSETLRHALTLGADDAIHVVTNQPTDTVLQPLVVAKIFKQLILESKYDLCLLGKQAIDDDSNQTSQILSGLLNWPMALFCWKITKISDKIFEVMREIDSGSQKVQIEAPCIFSCDLRLNRPRYATVRNIALARKKPIREIRIEDMNIDITPKMKILEVQEPPKKKGGIKVKDVDELIDKLINEVKLL